jgi:hypothetical protein
MQAGADREWIEASVRGDRAAFARLIERHQRAVYAVAFSATRDRALADDVTQDAFVTAWRRLARASRSRSVGRVAVPDRAQPRAGCAQARAHRGAGGRKVAAGSTPYDAISDGECERIVAAALSGRNRHRL